MIRRWLIRVPCLLALAFVVGVWVTSYFGMLFLHKCFGGFDCYVRAIHGLSAMGEWDIGQNPRMPLHVDFMNVSQP